MMGAEAASRVAVLLMVERLRLCAAKVLDAVQRRCQVADINVTRLLNHAVPLAARW